MSEYTAEKGPQNLYQIIHHSQERVMGRYMRLREIVKSGLTREEARKFIRDHQSRPQSPSDGSETTKHDWLIRNNESPSS